MEPMTKPVERQTDHHEAATTDGTKFGFFRDSGLVTAVLLSAHSLALSEGVIRLEEGKPNTKEVIPKHEDGGRNQSVDQKSYQPRHDSGE